MQHFNHHHSETIFMQNIPKYIIQTYEFANSESFGEAANLFANFSKNLKLFMLFLILTMERRCASW